MHSSDIYYEFYPEISAPRKKQQSKNKTHFSARHVKEKKADTRMSDSDVSRVSLFSGEKKVVAVK